jgi:hypothetical protein
MTVETLSTFPSPSEIAKPALRSMMSPDLNRTPSQRFVVREAEPRPEEAPPVRWPRVFPSL